MEQNIRKTAIERCLKGEDPKSIYSDLKRSKEWFFKWLRRYKSGDPDWSINPETLIGSGANPGLLTGNPMPSVKLKNSASSQSGTSWNLKNSLKSDPQPSNGSCANLDTRYHRIAPSIAF